MSRIFGQDLRLETPVKRPRHDRAFLMAIMVEDLHYRAYHHLSSESIGALIRGLREHCEDLPEGSRPALVFAYSVDPDGCADDIDIGVVRAFSTFEPSESGGVGLTHRYYERPGDGRPFELVGSLSCDVEGRLNFDDIRVLHFASNRSYDLPSRSTLYEFRSDSFAKVRLGPRSDRQLRLALIGDKDRGWGLPTIGLYGTEVFRSLRVPIDDGGPGGSCGQLDDCQAGSHPCGPDPIAGYSCVQDDGGGDGCVQVAQALSGLRIPLLEEVDFRTARLLHDSLLSRFERGREYVAIYFTASLFMKLDRRSIVEYVRFLPHINRALRVLLTGSDDSVVVTKQLRDTTLRLVASHRDVTELQEVLDRIEDGIERHCDETRSELLAAIGAPDSLYA